MIERLPFDCAWFGIEIGRLVCPCAPPPWDSSTEADRFDLVYLMGPTPQSLPLGSIGGRVTLVDLRLDLEREPRALTPGDSNTRVALLSSEVDIDQAASIAESAFTTSRFYREGALKNRAGNLYRKWVTNQKGSHEEGTGILGFLRPGSCSVGGFLVFRPDGPWSRVDLIGVAATMRGRGVGHALVDALQSRYPSKGLRVRVSADNPKALDFYLSVGFRPRSSDVIVHRWRHS